jgi:ComF family protein
MLYRDPIVEDLIRALKFDGDRRACALLAEALGEYLSEEVVSLRAFSDRPVVFIPIPLHAHRERKRGFNQMTRILEALPSRFREGAKMRIVTNVLIRTRDTVSQTTLTRAARVENMRNAFALLDSTLVRGTHVFVIDDVTTTGATLREAARPFEGVAASVRTIALSAS